MMEQLPPLTTDTIWGILNEELADETVNQLVWYHLGYRYDGDNQTWNLDYVSEPWKTNYPIPPDFIDSRPATVKLTRTIPQEYKQALKEQLNFKGYKIHELMPRLTRRATMANWLLAQLLSQGA